MSRRKSLTKRRQNPSASDFRHTPFTMKTNQELVRNAIGHPRAKEGAHYLALIAKETPGFSSVRRNAFLFALAQANAALLDAPVSPGATESEKASAAMPVLAGVNPEYLRAAACHEFDRLPVVRIEGPIDSFLVDLNGKPFARDGYAAYAAEGGSIFIDRVNLAEYCAFYEMTVQNLLGRSLLPLDLEWTTTAGLTDKAEADIREHGLINEAVSAAKAGHLERFDRLAAKAGDAVNLDGHTLSKALEYEQADWAELARLRAIESGFIVSFGHGL